MKKLKNVLLVSGLFLAILFLPSCGCGGNNNPKITVPGEAEIGNYNMSYDRSYYVDGSGMKYLMLEDSYTSEWHIVNITKDSLECEYYKQQLNKKFIKHSSNIFN